MKTCPFVVGLIVVPWLLVSADIIPTGYKRVQHLVEFSHFSAFTNYHFFLYPRDLPRDMPGNSSVLVKDGVAELSSLNPLAVGMNGGVYLYAFPRESGARVGYPLEDWFTNQTGTQLKSPRLVDPVRSLPNSDPRQQLITRYRIEGLPGKLNLINLDASTPPPKVRPTLKKSEVALLLVLTGIGVASFFGAWRRQRLNHPTL